MFRQFHEFGHVRRGHGVSKPRKTDADDAEKCAKLQHPAAICDRRVIYDVLNGADVFVPVGVQIMRFLGCVLPNVFGVEILGPKFANHFIDKLRDFRPEFHDDCPFCAVAGEDPNKSRLILSRHLLTQHFGYQQFQHVSGGRRGVI